MKSLTRRILVSLVLSAVTLFTAPSIYASCMFNFSGDLGDGFCSCGSSAGPYCMLYGGTDITDDIGTDGMHLVCDLMCPGVPYISKNSPTPSTPRMFTYPKSYQVARANRIELQRLKKTGSASPFATTTLYELVLR
jgi:hypothetical protein